MGVSLTSRLPQLEAQLLAKAEVGVQKAAADVEGQWKARAAVDTGAYRASVNADAGGGLSAIVASGVEYDKFLEYGTSKMPAQPAAVPAAEAVRPQYVAYMSRLI